VTSAAVLGRAQRLAAPNIALQGDAVVINVPYEGMGDVGGKPLPVGTGRTLLQLTVSPEGRTLRWDVRTSADTAPSPGLRMASMQPSGICDVCVVNMPVGDPTCLNCRTLVGQGDPWCLLSGWDRLCIDQAFVACSPMRCSCPHDTCTGGAWMHSSCENGTPRNTCVRTISAGDNYCERVGWDGICINESRTWCVPPGCH
jgi:hypothetical protein